MPHPCTCLESGKTKTLANQLLESGKTTLTNLVLLKQNKNLGAIHLVRTEKLTPLTPDTRAHQGVRNVSFTENFTYVLN